MPDNTEFSYTSDFKHLYLDPYDLLEADKLAERLQTVNKRLAGLDNFQETIKRLEAEEPLSINDDTIELNLFLVDDSREDLADFDVALKELERIVDVLQEIYDVFRDCYDQMESEIEGPIENLVHKLRNSLAQN